MTMLRVAIGLGVATAGIYIVTRIIAARLGGFVAARTLEHPATYQAYTTADLAQFVAAWPHAARAYVVPVLFPLDLLFMILLGATLTVAAVGFSEGTAFAPAARFFMILPLVYLAADLAEDTMLARLLLAPSAITNDAVSGAKALTTLKLGALVASTGQVLLLAVLYLKALLR